MPMLNSLPSSVKNLNVTMGFPLKDIPLAALFEQIFSLHKKNSMRFYYKDVIALISQTSIISACFYGG